VVTDLAKRILEVFLSCPAFIAHVVRQMRELRKEVPNVHERYARAAASAPLSDVQDERLLRENAHIKLAVFQILLNRSARYKSTGSTTTSSTSH
jgi:hypothetical protein